MIVGADSDYAIERPYRKYLAAHPSVASLDFFPAQNLFLEYYRKSLFNKILYRTGFSSILASINQELLKRADDCKPDVLLVFKGMEIYPATLKKLALKGVRLVNYNPDNPFIFSGRGSGNRNVTRSIRSFDLYLSYDKEVCEKMIEAEKVPSGLIPFGFELDEEIYLSCLDVPEVNKVCFIGNPDRQRLDFLNDIAASDVPLDVYGNGWDRLDLHDNISVKGYLKGNELWSRLRAYRVQLNLLRLHNMRSHNMRSFEIPAIGGIQLAPDTADHKHFFTSGKEIFLFNGVSDCVEAIRMLLAMPKADADLIRLAARKRCIESDYSYRKRVEELIFHLTNQFSSINS